jgi:hypothetical protein
MRYDRFTCVDKPVERFSRDDVVAPYFDGLQLAITNGFLDCGAFAGTILSGCIDVETVAMDTVLPVLLFLGLFRSATSGTHLWLRPRSLVS